MYRVYKKIPPLEGTLPHSKGRHPFQLSTHYNVNMYILCIVEYSVIAMKITTLPHLVILLWTWIYYTHSEVSCKTIGPSCSYYYVQMWQWDNRYFLHLLPQFGKPSVHLTFFGCYWVSLYYLSGQKMSLSVSDRLGWVKKAEPLWFGYDWTVNNYNAIDFFAKICDWFLGSSTSKYVSKFEWQNRHHVPS